MIPIKITGGMTVVPTWKGMLWNIEEGMALATSKQSCFVLGSSKEMLGTKGEKMSVLPCLWGEKWEEWKEQKWFFLVEMRIKDVWKMLEVKLL